MSTLLAGDLDASCIHEHLQEHHSHHPWHTERELGGIFLSLEWYQISVDDCCRYTDRRSRTYKKKALQHFICSNEQCVLKVEEQDKGALWPCKMLNFYAKGRSFESGSGQAVNPWLIPDCTESGYIGAQDMQHWKLFLEGSTKFSHREVMWGL